MKLRILSIFAMVFAMIFMTAGKNGLLNLVIGIGLISPLVVAIRSYL